MACAFAIVCRWWPTLPTRIGVLAVVRGRIDEVTGMCDALARRFPTT